MIRGKVLPQVTDAAMDGCEIFVRRGRMCLSVFRSVIILVLVLGACRASRRSPPSQLTATEEGEVKVRQANLSDCYFVGKDRPHDRKRPAT